MKKSILVLATLGLGVGCIGSALASATANAAIEVSATAITSCTMSAAPLNFGTYLATVSSPDTNAQTSVSIECSTGTGTGNLTVDGGLHYDTGSTTRRLEYNTGINLNYSLYSDSGYSTPLNVGTKLPVNVSGSPVTVPIYGKIPGGQMTDAVTLTDTVTATLTVD